MDQILAVLPVLLILCLMAFFRLSAIISCTIGLVVALVVAMAYFYFPPILALSSVLRGVVASWDLAYLVFAGILFGILMEENRTLDKIRIILEGAGLKKSEQLMAVVLGFVPFISAVIGPGSFFVAIPLLLAVGISPELSASGFLMGQAWGLTNFTFGVPCFALATSTGLLAADLTRLSSIIMAPLIIVSSVLVRIWLQDLRKIPIGRYLAICFCVVIAYVIGGMMGPAFPTLFAGITGLFMPMLICGYNERRNQARELQLQKADKSVNIAMANPSAHWKTTFRQFFPLGLVVILSIFNRTDLFKSFSNTGSFIVSIPFSTDSITINLLQSGATPIIIGSLLAYLLEKGARAEMKKGLRELPRRSASSLVIVPIAICLAEVMSSAGMIDIVAEKISQGGKGLFVYTAPLLGMFGHYVTGSLISGNIIMGSFIDQSARLVNVSPLLASSIAAVGGSLAVSIIPSKIGIAAGVADCLGSEGSILRRNISIVLTLWLILGLIIWFCLRFDLLKAFL